MRPAFAENSPLTFLFCYENKEFYPHFTGNSTTVPSENAGTVVDILIELNQKVNEININFIRKPWARCLSMLKTGEVTAIIGSYSKDRATYGRYPMKGKQLDNSRAFEVLSTCLLKHDSALLSWDGKKLFFESPPVIAIPYGYHITEQLQQLGFIVYKTDSLKTAYTLLKGKRVSASIIDCKTKAIPDNSQLNTTPIREHDGYFIINNDFYNAHPNLSEKIWNTLSQINKKEHYSNYKLVQ
ncbi:hypothetical protein [Litorilituus lipolyticus]|uniref:hypothetical protein n=1 Tax=Litorilituus lipolyticus TaxID=2491017 RepID=UPI00112E75C8|nr:hypothetical protein [Litorilituus lipolyticus]